AAAGRWVEAAQHGLRDDVLATAATAVFELACRALPALDPPAGVRMLVEEITERRVRRARCPADEFEPGLTRDDAGCCNGSRVIPPRGETGGQLP
ncbi:MAG: hypothetical protein ACRDRV_01210, partial [Pseudonocardiaceae bacterium]